MALTGERAFTRYSDAEKFADEWAGDTQEHAAVVEDFGSGLFHVMDYEAAEAYVKDNDAEIQYDPDYRPDRPH
jgi:hypothetical protein